MRSRFTNEASLLEFILPLLVQGVALATFFLAMITILLDGVPPQKIPLASGLSNFARITGGGFAASIVTTLWDRREALHQSRLADHTTIFTPGLSQTLTNLHGLGFSDLAGKAAVARVQAVVQKKQTEGAAKAKQLQDNQAKLQSSGSVMNEAARTQLEKEIERQQREGERFQQDAQAEINELQQEVQNEFVKKLSPILEQLGTEKGLQILFNSVESGIAWAMPGLDITADVVKKLDSAAKPAGTPKP